MIEKKNLVGRYEWCSLPRLNIPAIKAKIDTGAKTSAIHAVDIKTFLKRRKNWVRFKVYPLQGRTDIIVECETLVHDERYIMSSNGHKEHRYVILTSLTLADKIYEIELSLSNRDPLTFRMLLGREALAKCAIVDPSVKCQHGIYNRSDIKKLYLTNGSR